MGCVSLASLAWRELGIEHDETLILEWLNRAAGLDRGIIATLWRMCPTDASACALEAFAWSHGVGVAAADTTRAHELMTLACDHGDATACRAR